MAFISLLSDLGYSVTSFHSIMVFHPLRLWAKINPFILEKLTKVLRRYEQEVKPPVEWSLTSCVYAKFPSFRGKSFWFQFFAVCLWCTGDEGPPPSTIINHNETFAKVVFKPTVVQQAKIAQNGILGDFIIRYDVKREQNIGDIQVLPPMMLPWWSPSLSAPFRTTDSNTCLKRKIFPVLRKTI